MKRIIYSLTVSIILSGTIHAQDLNNRAIWNPPERYDKTYTGKLIEYPVEQQAVRRYCMHFNSQFGTDLQDSEHIRGCAFRFTKENVCIIVYINHFYGLASPQAVRRHEIGHCNGWPSHHPD